MAGDEEEHTLVEEREEEMVSSPGSKQQPMIKKGWFLKPFSTSKKISLSSSSGSYHCKASNFTNVQFNGWVNKLKHWDNWVAKLKPIYKDLWKKVGIYDAIIASTYKFRRDPSSLLGVAWFWCEETNTFLFPWAEATVTLEDVMILGGFSVLGEPVRTTSPLDGELGALECEMLREIKKFNRTKFKKADISIWMKHYMEERNGDELEHIAFLAMWLSRFVLLAPPARTIRQDVIPVAIRLARVERIALAPAVLASLYRDLQKMKGYLASNRTPKSPPLIVWSPLYILQLWVWERFIALQPELSNFIDSHKPRAARWHELGMKLEYKFVMSVIKSRDQVQWRPYGTSLDHWCRPSHYRDDGGWVSNNDEGLESFVRCLRDCELVGLDCIEQYLPHRVARQFGLDQDIPCCVPRANSTWEVAWATYDIGGKSVRFYVPHRLSESDVTLLYSIWWESVRRVSRKNVNGKNPESLSRRKKEKVQASDGITVSGCLARRKKEKVQASDGITVSGCLAHRKKEKVQASDGITVSDCLARRRKKKKVEEGGGITVSDCLARHKKKKVQAGDGITISQCLACHKKKKVQDGNGITISHCLACHKKKKVRRKKKKVQDSNDIRLSNCQVRVHDKKRKVQDIDDVTLSDRLVRFKKKTVQDIDDIPLSDRLACLRKKKVQDVDDIPLSDWLAQKERSISSKKPPKLPTGVTATQDQLACEKSTEKCFDLILYLETSEAMTQDADASNNVQVENETGISHPLGIDDKGVARDIKEPSAGESVGDPMVMQDLEETFDMEEVEESTGTKDRRSEDIDKNGEKCDEQSLPLETSETTKQDADSLSNVQVENGAVISNPLDSNDEGVVGEIKETSAEESVYVLMKDVEETSDMEEAEESSGTKVRRSEDIEKLENTEICVEQNLPFETSVTMKQDADSLSNVRVENAAVISNPLDTNDKGVVGDIKEISAEESVYVLVMDVDETSDMVEVEECSGAKVRRSEDIEKLKNTEQNLLLESSEILMKQDADALSNVQVDNGELVSNPLIIDDMGVVGDIKETNGRGSVYDPVLIENLDETFDLEELIENLDETFDLEELDERTDAEDKRAEDIDKLKEEIAMIEARVKELESQTEMDH